MGLYCHTGTITEYLSGFLADGMGTRHCNYSYGDSRRGEHSFLLIDFLSLRRTTVHVDLYGILTFRETGRVGLWF